MMRFIPPISLIAFIVVQINAASLPRPQTNSIPASPAPPLVEPARALPTKSPDTNAPSSTPVYQRPRAAINTVRPTSTGAEATYGRHKVQFANDAASPRPIIIVTPGGEKLSSRASFLALYDRASDQTQLIGGITNATGRITSASQVTYSNAF